MSSICDNSPLRVKERMRKYWEEQGKRAETGEEEDPSKETGSSANAGNDTENSVEEIRMR